MDAGWTTWLPSFSCPPESWATRWTRLPRRAGAMAPTKPMVAIKGRGGKAPEHETWVEPLLVLSANMFRIGPAGQ